MAAGSLPFCADAKPRRRLARRSRHMLLLWLPLDEIEQIHPAKQARRNSMLPSVLDNFEEARSRFQWQVPEYYNIGHDACGKWAERDANRLALIFLDAQGQAQRFSF